MDHTCITSTIGLGGLVHKIRFFMAFRIILIQGQIRFCHRNKWSLLYESYDSEYTVAKRTDQKRKRNKKKEVGI